MKKIRPYLTIRGAMNALDNGGRFFNIFSSKDDGMISEGELALAAGVISANTSSILYLEMSLACLIEDDRAQIRSNLSAKLRKHWEEDRPAHLSPVGVEQLEGPGHRVIVEGYLRFVRDVGHFSAYIAAPSSSGKGHSIITVPFSEHFDVYELFEDHERMGPCCIVAVTKGKPSFEGRTLRIGGIMRRFSAQEERLYLEALFYSEL